MSKQATKWVEDNPLNLEERKDDSIYHLEYIADEYAARAYDAGRDSMKEAPKLVLERKDLPAGDKGIRLEAVTPAGIYIITCSRNWKVPWGCDPWYCEWANMVFKLGNNEKEAQAACEADWQERWKQLMKMKEEQQNSKNN